MKRALDALYVRFNRREFVHPDPLTFLYDYDDPIDREIVGLIAASLAYGRVVQIHRNVSVALGKMPSPARFLREASEDHIAASFSGFRHRFTRGRELGGLIIAVKRIMASRGGLGVLFAEGCRENEETLLPALSRFVSALIAEAPCPLGHLIAVPDRGSACKRLNLYLRWMVRRDDVDPGGWDGIPREKLIVPLDTHMHRMGVHMGLTERRSGDMRTALEITEAFKAIAPDDPTKYDFSITRIGILGPPDRQSLLDRLRPR